MMAAARASGAGVVSVAVLCLIAPAWAGEDCATEAAALVQLEAELPQLDLTPPIHHQLVCITLETLVDFAVRVGHHRGRCPASAYAVKAGRWDEARSRYAAQFRQHRCRRAL